MKKYIYTIICVLFLSSCSDELEIVPKSTLSSSAMWKTESDALGAMYGVFAQLRSALNSNYIFWGDYRSNLFGVGVIDLAEALDMYNNTLDMQDTGTDWQSLYTTINDCNLILRHIPDISFNNEDTKNFILGNVYFVRALCYFYCARVWGDAPIVLSGYESDAQEDLFPTRSPLKEVLAQVESDIEMSVNSFPDDEVISSKIASKAAANMLKTDFYLWMAKTQDGGIEALNKANSAIDNVLNDSGIELSDNYEDVFRDDENKEIIFALDFARNEYVGGFCQHYLLPIQNVLNQELINNPVQVGSHMQRVCLTDEYISLLQEDSKDTRAKVSYDSYYDSVNNVKFQWINKYLGEWADGTRYFTSDIKIYRYAEAIMFKAEIENELGNTSAALMQLNKVTKRAYKMDNYYSGSYSKAEFDEIIVNERLKEFSVEGKSWFDLIRFGVVFDRVESLIGRENELNILFWPVNVNSINTNPNIQQTPGYN